MAVFARDYPCVFSVRLAAWTEYSWHLDGTPVSMRFHFEVRYKKNLLETCGFEFGIVIECDSA